MKIDDIDFRNHSSEEILQLLLDAKKPQLDPLIVLISRAIAYQKLNHVVRMAIADSEREVETLRRGRGI